MSLEASFRTNDAPQAISTPCLMLSLHLWHVGHALAASRATMKCCHKEAALLFCAFVFGTVYHALPPLSLFLVRDRTQLCSRDTSTDHLATFWAPFVFFKRAFGFVKTNYPKHWRVIKTP